LSHHGLYPDPPHGWIDAWREKVWQSVIDKGLEVDPLSIQLQRMKTFYPMYSSTPEEAMWHAQRLIELAPDSPTGYGVRGSFSRSFEGRVDEAMRWFSRGARMNSDKNPLYEISLEYLQLGDYDTALQYNSHYQSVIDRAPGYMNMERAIALLYLGRRDEAIDVLEPIAANLMSDGRNALRALAILAGLDIDRGAVDAAVARYDEVRRACVEYEHKRDQNCPIELLRIAQLSGDEDQVRPVIDEFYESVVHPYIEAGVRFPGQNYRICYLALTDQHDEALDLLEAMSLGELLTNFGHTWQIARDYDPTFDAIRDHPRFRAVFAKVEVEMAKQLEHVRQMEKDGEIVTLEELREMGPAAK